MTDLKKNMNSNFDSQIVAFYEHFSRHWQFLVQCSSFFSLTFRLKMSCIRIKAHTLKSDRSNGNQVQM